MVDQLFNLTGLTLQEVEKIYRALGELPYKQSASAIAKINEQMNNQTNQVEKNHEAE